MNNKNKKLKKGIRVYQCDKMFNTCILKIKPNVQIEQIKTNQKKYASLS